MRCGTAVKKKETYEVYDKPKVATVKKDKKKLSKKSKTSSIIWVLSMFIMLMALIYRFNLINEKNLETQSLKEKLETLESSAITEEEDLAQSTDLNAVEAYAKQQLGMQKPNKNQIVYIDNSKGNSVSAKTDTTVIDKIQDILKQVINKIF